MTKTLNNCFLAFALLFVLDWNVLAQESPEMLLQTGIYAEEVQGDLAKALSFFNKIVHKYPDHRSIAANALLHIGFCYEKIGQEKAREAYQKIIDQYPDQRQIAAIARDKLAQIKRKPKPISPLVKYYFERLGIDITTATSWDGKYLAYTDWTNGNLFIKNLITGNKRRLTDVDWSQAYQYAYHPRWSRDDKYIAYSYCRKPYFIELRVVSVTDGKSRAVYSNTELIIFPQDWHPDGKRVLCESYNFKRKPYNHLVMIAIDSLKLKELTPLGENSLGMKISPDGKYVTYDWAHGGRRSIYLFVLKDLQQINVGVNLPTPLSSYYAPIWSKDGKLILCRSTNQYELWAIPINNGIPTAKPYLVQTDISKALLSIKGITHQQRNKLNKTGNSIINKEFSKKQVLSFKEEFSSPILDSAWSIFEWKSDNVYDYATFGRYSLIDNPGYLRYYSDPMINGTYHQHSYLPKFSGWYWDYPALELSRPIAGDNWVIETKACFSLSSGANTRSFELVIVFDAELNRENYLVISRSNEYRPGQNEIDVGLWNSFTTVVRKKHQFFPDGISGIINYTCYYRITRSDTTIQVAISEDGKEYLAIFSATIPPELLGLTQSLALTGNGWFVPAGSYADWDYIRFSILD